MPWHRWGKSHGAHTAHQHQQRRLHRFHRLQLDGETEPFRKLTKQAKKRLKFARAGGRLSTRQLEPAQAAAAFKEMQLYEESEEGPQTYNLIQGRPGVALISTWYLEELLGEASGTLDNDRGPHCVGP